MFICSTDSMKLDPHGTQGNDSQHANLLKFYILRKFDFDLFATYPSIFIQKKAISER